MKRTPEVIEDELLVLQCQDGKADALESLIARWQPRLAGLAWRLTGDREDARDIVQDAWLAIVRGLRRLDDPARFRTWAYRIITNKCADRVRRRVVRRDATHEVTEAAESSGTGVSSAANEAGEIRRLRAALATLPDEQKAIVSLHYLEGMSVADIALVLDVPEGTVKSRLFHARNRLKQTLERTE